MCMYVSAWMCVCVDVCVGMSIWGHVCLNDCVCIYVHVSWFMYYHLHHTIYSSKTYASLSKDYLYL